MSQGKRVGTRRAPKKRSLPTRGSMAYCLAITLSVVAWGYLVFAAIDFGASARDGESGAWLFLSLACVGAAACLFAGLILTARLLRSLGITRDLVADETPRLGLVPDLPPDPAPGPPALPPTYAVESPATYRGKRAAR